MSPAIGDSAKKKPAREKKVSGHASFLGNVYVNDTAKDAFMSDARPVFPQGSILVREKILDGDSSKAELLTVMIKREKGLSPQSWEYLVMESDATRVRRREKAGECFACHRQQKKDDFVFRSYLPRKSAG
jgi:hypothetical protein